MILAREEFPIEYRYLKLLYKSLNVINNVIVRSVTYDFLLSERNKKELVICGPKTRMWAYAQCDGHPRNIGGALC